MKLSKIIRVLLVSALGICVLAGCSSKDAADNAKKTDSGAENGNVENGGAESQSDKIHATIIIVPEDKTEKKHEIEVSKDLTIREALYEANLIDDENKVSLFITTIDGETADFNEGVTWVMYDGNGDQITSDSDSGLPADTVKVNDGDTVKFVYEVVPNFDD